MYYVYIIQSINFSKEIYIGFSSNLKERIREHNSGDSPHTKKFKPWKIVFYSAFENKKTAIEFEDYLKSGSGRSFRNKRLIGK
jgi:predicted GIY-YIG superfamily endonuclease